MSSYYILYYNCIIILYYKHINIFLITMKNMNTTISVYTLNILTVTLSRYVNIYIVILSTISLLQIYKNIFWSES